ncbi:BLUF domain-containing protein [Sphingorhabdus sp. SMR4y]|uniref:BLUF domain-containing protein n=1 Tax=Sphingorhabdus sp. SMR4y TaxID=2584094 RepID=UPI000B5C5DD1|nr:BLUF domain-containing protein [Sphingorhabdus sp. SMR4y]ASK86905.1 sensors of blue-light using FAD [Sphingorhabdus sp. SMR4y]
MPNGLITSISYISTARAGLTEEDFQNILAEAGARNDTLGLTGLLAFNGLNFMQILEGSRLDLNQCMALIEADPRHDGLVIFDRREIRRREFPDWQMAGIMVDQTGQKSKAKLEQILAGDGVRPETRKHFESFHSFGAPAR